MPTQSPMRASRMRIFPAGLLVQIVPVTVVLALLKEATRAGKQFTVMVTEGRPDASGCRMAEELIAGGIPTTLVLDSAAAYMMERVDMVLIGSEGVVENGGIINKIGTFQIATVRARSYARDPPEILQRCCRDARATWA
eukprot:5878985-Pyramimonas_sp.AAC.1